VKVFSNRKEAIESQEKEDKVFLIGEIERFLNISDNPVDSWGYFFCDEPMDRFRLLTGRPLERLLSRDFIANWELGVVTRTGRPFTTYMIEYDKETGQWITTEGGNPKLFPVSPQSEGLLSPVSTNFCGACKLIRDKCYEQREQDTSFIDPCLECNSKLASSLFSNTDIDQEELRLAVADPRYNSSQLSEKLRSLCWLGLYDMVFPVMVADIIVGIVFTGQLRLKGANLSKEQKDYRLETLNKLGLPVADILKEIKVMKEVTENEAENIWRELRESAHQLQMICASRYGQMGAVRESLLAGKLRNQVRNTPMLSKKKARILSDVGHEALKEISTFFSFQRAAMLTMEGGEWKASACWTKNQYRNADLPIKVEVNLSADVGKPVSEKTEKIRSTLWPEVEPQSYYHWVRGDQDTWYLYMVRKFEKNYKPRAKLNRFSQNLVREMTLIFHQEIFTQLSAHQQIDNIRHIIHDLGGPGAALASALAEFDATVYGKHLNEMNSLSYNYKFLTEAIVKLGLDIERSRRRISFELGRFEAGIDIEKQLIKGGKKISIFDPTQAPGEGPSGLWDKALWSFDMYSGDMSIREISLYQDVKKQSLIDKHLRINENALQIVLDNMVDNAVKYAYDETEIRLKMHKEEIDGRDYCTLSIGNFGNGILETERKKVWERFYRGTYSTTRKKQVAGSGLGMFIIKEVIEYYGGIVGIDSHFGGNINYKPGEGFYTRVWISLPIF
jgi:signal transduction histidine kinase